MTAPKSPWRFFLFNLVLFLTIGSFAGFEVMDFLPGDGNMLIGILVGSVLAAIISTSVHMNSACKAQGHDAGHKHGAGHGHE